MVVRNSRLWLVIALLVVGAVMWATRPTSTVHADAPTKSPEGAPAVIQPRPDWANRPSAWNLTENFDGVVPTGWTANNQSVPVGTIGWFQGNDAVFPAHQGAPTAYAGVNFNSGGGLATISNWLISPVLTINKVPARPAPATSPRCFWTSTRPIPRPVIPVSGPSLQARSRV
jgi:hypothetical protein